MEELEKPRMLHLILAKRWMCSYSKIHLEVSLLTFNKVMFAFQWGKAA